MSCTEIYTFNKNGNSKLYGEIKNPWSGAVFIWSELYRKYFNKDFVMRQEQVELLYWMCKVPIAPLYERVVLATTGDNVIVFRKDFELLKDSFSKFVEEHTTENLQTQLKMIQDIIEDEDIIAIAWNQTSVRCDPLWIDYNCLTGNEHSDIIEALGTLNEYRPEDTFNFNIEEISNTEIIENCDNEEKEITIYLAAPASWIHYFFPGRYSKDTVIETDISISYPAEHKELATTQMGPVDMIDGIMTTYDWCDIDLPKDVIEKFIDKANADKNFKFHIDDIYFVYCKDKENDNITLYFDVPLSLANTCLHKSYKHSEYLGGEIAISYPVGHKEMATAQIGPQMNVFGPSKDTDDSIAVYEWFDVDLPKEIIKQLIAKAHK